MRSKGERQDGKTLAEIEPLHVQRYEWASERIKGRNVLDCACGGGYGSYLIAINNPNCRVLGVDVSPDAIDHAKKHFALPNITYEVGDMLTLNLKRKFDTIVSLESIEHVSTPENAIANFKKHLMLEGNMIISLPTVPSLSWAKYHKFEVSDAQEALAFLTSCGLSSIEFTEQVAKTKTYGLFNLENDNFVTVECLHDFDVHKKGEGVICQRYIAEQLAKFGFVNYGYELKSANRKEHPTSSLKYVNNKSVFWKSKGIRLSSCGETPCYPKDVDMLPKWQANFWNELGIVSTTSPETMQTDKVLVVGSGVSAKTIKNMDIGDWTLVCVHNAWKLRNDWRYLCAAMDFQNLPAKLREQQEFVFANSIAETLASIGEWKGGARRTMFFTTSFWVLHVLRPKVIGFIGCDMQYEGEINSIYGKARPDPMNLTAYQRQIYFQDLQREADKRCCRLINFSDTKTLLPFERNECFTKRKVIIAGSGANMKRLNEWDTLGYIIVVINNAWRFANRWNYLCYPGDFTNLPDPIPDGKTLVTGARVNSIMSRKNPPNKSYKETMFFTASYWAAVELHAEKIGYIGCDMQYGTGNACYGESRPDPLDHVDKLEAWFSDWQKYADERHINLVNYSEDVSRLPYKREKFTPVLKGK